MDVDVEIERPAEPLDHGHGPSATIVHAVQARAAPQPAEHSAQEDRDDGAAQRVVPRQLVAQAKRQAQDPLPDRDIREDVVHQVRGALSHPATTAAWTEAPSLTGERDEPVQAAGVAAKPGKPAG